MNLSLTPAEQVAEQCIGMFGRNDDARCTATCDSLFAIAGHISREYGDYGYQIGQVANAGLGGVFSVRHFDGSTFYVAVDRYGNVARIPETSDEPA
jgi:hypothetical protein